ncbi:MAG: hypothetical protein ACW974_09025 [Candidatus Thorarchaeota archaeon]
MTEKGRTDKIGESLRLINEGKKQGVILRMIGGLAVRAHCEDLEFCEREYGDIDLVAPAKEIAKIRETFAALGYLEDVSVARSTDRAQLLFRRHDSQDHVDVFLDKLRMEHTIDLRNRLQIEELTISVSDILVTKLIVYVTNEKDYRDIFTIIKDMKVGHEDKPGEINIDYIANICSKDWGLFQDIRGKIDECLQVMTHFDFSESESKLIRSNFQSVKEAIMKHPKSLRWKLRGLVGTRQPWRETVEEEDLSVSDLSTELSKAGD